jgi:hypothetical protein
MRSRKSGNTLSEDAEDTFLVVESTKPAPQPVAAFNLPIVQFLIGVAVYGSYFIAPASIRYSYGFVNDGFPFEKMSTFGTILTIWALLESAFLFHFLNRLIWFQRKAQWRPLPTTGERLELWGRMLAAMPKGPKHWLSSWYSGIPFESLTSGDVDDILMLMFNFNTESGAAERGKVTGSGMSEERWKEIDTMVTMLTDTDPTISFRPGPAKNRQFLMSFMTQPCLAWAPALLLYLLVNMLHFSFSVYYLKRGYIRGTAGQLVYW